MHLLKRSTGGTYKPSFFSLMIDAKDVLTPNNKMRSTHSTVFFHEYVHYLQDLLTNYGLHNIIQLAYEYSALNNEIINAPSPTFSIPYMTANKDLRTSQELNGLLWGSDYLDDEDREFEVVSIGRERYECNEALNFHLITVEIIYRDTLFKDQFYLGAVHFLENLAHLLERSLTWEDAAPSFPYKVVEKVIRVIFLDGDYSAENMVKFMEDALDSYNPAEYLFQFHEFCTDPSINATFTRRTIDSFRLGYRLEIDHKNIDTLKLYFRNGALARRGLDNLFNHERLSGVKGWSRHVLSEAILLKRHGFSFTQILSTGLDHDKVKMKIEYLVRKLGSPVMMDKTSRIFYIPPHPSFNNAMIYLLGLEAVMEILRGTLPCGMLNMCRHEDNDRDITNDYCLNAPWRRAEQNPPCLVAQFWIMWGFVKKEVAPSAPTR